MSRCVYHLFAVFNAKLAAFTGLSKHETEHSSPLEMIRQFHLILTASAIVLKRTKNPISIQIFVEAT